MTFEGQYLTYAEYQDLGGSAIGKMPFNLLEFEARRRIDELTSNRLVDGIDIPQKVKLCEFTIIDKVLKTYDKETNRGKSSESVGSYSVSYSSIKDIIENKKEEISDIILTTLYGVIYNGEHILYCGV